jgi:hypothetical protein
MYTECAEGKLDPSWKVPIEDLHTFHERLSEQMLQYDPRHRLYPGDVNLRDCTQQNKKARQKSVKTGNGLAVEPSEKRGRGRPKKNVEATPARRASVNVDGVTHELLKDNIVCRDKSLCGNFTSLTRHVNSKKYDKHGGQCAFCGIIAHSRCMVCNDPATGISKGYDCFFKWHDEAYFGLGRMDSVCIFNKWKNDWTPPNRMIKQRNERHINNLKNVENDSSAEDDSSNNMR